MKKKDYPGGVKLTATKARAVAMQEFGTAKGLTKEETAMPGYFKMKLGSLFIRIHPDTSDGTGCIVVSAELAFATGQNPEIPKTGHPARRFRRAGTALQARPAGRSERLGANQRGGLLLRRSQADLGKRVTA